MGALHEVNERAANPSAGPAGQNSLRGIRCARPGTQLNRQTHRPAHDNGDQIRADPIRQGSFSGIRQSLKTVAEMYMQESVSYYSCGYRE